MIVKTNQEIIEAFRASIDSEFDNAEYVRIYVKSSCCKGPSFGITLDDITEDDLKDDSSDVTFIMSKEAYDQAGDVVIESSGEGYSIESVVKPESECGSCGCGK